MGQDVRFTEAELIELETEILNPAGFWCDAGGQTAYRVVSTFTRLLNFARQSAVEPIKPFTGPILVQRKRKKTA